MRPGRWPGSGIKGQLQETSSSGHVARPPPPPRPLVGSSRRTQSPPFQALGPRGQSGAGRGGRRGCGRSFRGAGFGGRGLHRGPNLPGAEVFFSLTLQAASDGAEPLLSAPPPWRPIRGLSVPPGGAGPRRALGSAPSRLANFAGPAARRAAPRAHVRAGGGAAGTAAGLGDPGCCRRPSTEPPAARRTEARGSALRRALAGALGETHGEPGGQPRLRGRGASSDARRSPRFEERRPPRPPQRLGRPAAALLGRRRRSPSPPPSVSRAWCPENRSCLRRAGAAGAA